MGKDSIRDAIVTHTFPFYLPEHHLPATVSSLQSPSQGIADAHFLRSEATNEWGGVTKG